MFSTFTLLLVSSMICAVLCNDDTNYDNIKRFMSQSPEGLAKTLQLLENPYIAAALVNSNKKQYRKESDTREESNNLLNFLLSQREGDGLERKYKIENPQLPLVPPVVDAKGIEKDPLLGSFFQDTMEDQPPLESARNTNVPFADSHQVQQEVKSQHFTSIRNTTPVYQQSKAYYYIPPSYFQPE